MKRYSKADLKEPIRSISTLAGLKKIIKLKKINNQANFIKTTYFVNKLALFWLFFIKTRIF